MPPRPRHIPHSMERTTLQRMSPTEGLPIEKLHPSGKHTVAGMLAKGWIERRSDDRGRAIYCITEAGADALRTLIPPKGR
jgi:hypothetical protein